MASINKIILIGNLGRDPEMRSFPSGGQIANVSLATTEKWRDRQSGEMREHTEWHRLVFNGRLAEIAGQYLRKGSPIYIEGKLRTRKWQGQDGQDRYTTEVRVDQMQMLGRASESGNYSEPAPRAAPASSQQAPAASAKASDLGDNYDDGFGGLDEDIPF